MVINGALLKLSGAFQSHNPVANLNFVSLNLQISRSRISPLPRFKLRICSRMRSWSHDIRFCLFSWHTFPVSFFFWVGGCGAMLTCPFADELSKYQDSSLQIKSWINNSSLENASVKPVILFLKAHKIFRDSFLGDLVMFPDNFPSTRIFVFCQTHTVVPAQFESDFLPSNFAVARSRSLCIVCGDRK